MAIYRGDFKRDERGKVTFINDFAFQDVKRFYMVENRKKGDVRAWHGHKKEAKYVYVVQGEALIAIRDMETDAIQTFFLSADKPEVLYIPPNNYNGAQTLTDDTKIMYFSTATLEQSRRDDYRRGDFTEIWVDV